MNKIARVLAAFGTGLALSGPWFCLVLSAVTAVHSGIVAGLGLLVVSPLYVLLFIVVFLGTAVPAAFAAGIGMAIGVLLPGRAGPAVATFLSALAAAPAARSLCSTAFERALSPAETATALIVGGLLMATATAVLTQVLRIQRAPSSK